MEQCSSNAAVSYGGVLGGWRSPEDKGKPGKGIGFGAEPVPSWTGNRFKIYFTM